MEEVKNHGAFLVLIMIESNSPSLSAVGYLRSKYPQGLRRGS